MKISKIVAISLLMASSAMAIVNINTASKEELMSIGGIGESKADAIINYRKDNKFKSIEDIKNVKGISDGVFSKIKEDLAVSGKTDISTNMSKKSKNAKKAKDDTKDKMMDKSKENGKKMKNDMKNKTEKMKDKAVKKSEKMMDKNNIDKMQKQDK